MSLRSTRTRTEQKTCAHFWHKRPFSQSLRSASSCKSRKRNHDAHQDTASSSYSLINANLGRVPHMKRFPDVAVSRLMALQACVVLCLQILMPGLHISPQRCNTISLLTKCLFLVAAVVSIFGKHFSTSAHENRRGKTHTSSQPCRVGVYGADECERNGTHKSNTSAVRHGKIQCLMLQSLAYPRCLSCGLALHGLLRYGRP